MWVKGQSGNPSGKPKTHPLIKEMFSKRVEAAIAAIDECLASGEPELMLKAANMILDRALGKPAQAIEHSGRDGLPLAAAINILQGKPPNA